MALGSGSWSRGSRRTTTKIEGFSELTVVLDWKLNLNSMLSLLTETVDTSELVLLELISI